MHPIAWTPGTHVLEWAQTEIDGQRGAPAQWLRPGAEWRWFGRAQRMDRAGDVLELDISGRELQTAPRPRHAREVAARLSGRERACHPVMAQEPVPEPPRDGFLLTDGRRRYEARIIRKPDGTPRLIALWSALPLPGMALRIVARALPPSARLTQRISPGLNGIAALAGDALIDTPDGPRAADALRPGDLVLTRDSGAQPLRWTGTLALAGGALRRSPALRPVLVAPDALGPACPHEPLRLSQEHRLLLGGARAQALFHDAEVLVRAADLVNGRSIRFDDAPAGLRYVQLLLDRHHVLSANGVPVESFHPRHGAGALADRKPPDPARDFLFRDAPDDFGPEARRCLSAGEAALLAA